MNYTQNQPSISDLLKMATAAQYTTGRRVTPTADAYLFAAITFAALAVFGRSFVPVLNSFREMLLEPVGAWTAAIPHGYMTWGPLLMVGSLAGFATTWRARSFGIGTLLSSGAGLGGAGLGLALNPGAWTASAYRGGGGLWQELAFRAPTLLPAVLLSGAAAMIVLALVWVGHKSRRMAKVTERRNTGHRVVGRITTAAHTNVWLHGQPVYDVAVEYVTPHGKAHGTGKLTTLVMPSPGMPIEVIVDPSRPGEIELELPTSAYPMASAGPAWN